MYVVCKGIWLCVSRVNMQGHMGWALQRASHRVQGWGCKRRHGARVLPSLLGQPEPRCEVVPRKLVCFCRIKDAVYAIETLVPATPLHHVFPPRCCPPTATCRTSGRSCPAGAPSLRAWTSKSWSGRTTARSRQPAWACTASSPSSSCTEVPERGGACVVDCVVSADPVLCWDLASVAY